QLPPAPSTEEVTRRRSGNSGGGSRTSTGRITDRVEPPSSRFTEHTEGDLFRVSVPSNWRELSGSSGVTFAPDGAYGGDQGRSVFTHGVEIGVSRNESHDLQEATKELVDSLARTNPRLSRVSDSRRIS